MASPPRENLFAVSTPGLEGALEHEARVLGMEALLKPGGVDLVGEPGLYRRANLYLRTASRVLLRLAILESRDPAGFVRGLKGIPVDRYVPSGASVRVHVSAKGAPRIDVARAMSQAWSVRVKVTDSQEDGGYFLVRWEDGRWSVSVDTSGELLHRRGYRQEISMAPLRETLAAGVLLLAGYKGQGPLLDPMCGSGTLAIEAALWARRVPPGLKRQFAFEDWPSADKKAWELLLEEARAGVLPNVAQPIRASDIHAGALGTARRNARRAGVLGEIQLLREDATKLQAANTWSSGKGMVISNLPYGDRVGSRQSLETLYLSFAKALRDGYAGWRAALLVEDARRLDSALGFAPAASFPLSNGGKRCQLRVFNLP